MLLGSSGGKTGDYKGGGGDDWEVTLLNFSPDLVADGASDPGTVCVHARARACVRACVCDSCSLTASLSAFALFDSVSVFVSVCRSPAAAAERTADVPGARVCSGSLRVLIGHKRRWESRRGRRCL